MTETVFSGKKLFFSVMYLLSTSLCLLSGFMQGFKDMIAHAFICNVKTRLLTLSYKGDIPPL